MKARFFKKFSLGLVLSAMPFVGGGDQETTSATRSLISANGEEPLYTTETNATSLVGGPIVQESDPPPPVTAPVATPVPNAGEKLSPNIKLSSSVGEVVKLAQSGVDDSVMLSYVSNSPGLFNLSSDEIIYLNDLGVSDGVVTGMIQHDQALKQTWTETAQAQNAAAQANAQAAQAAAPSDATPPQAESQPAQVVDTAQPQPANVNYNYFYDSLSPYGTWIDVAGYGRCWQPTVVVLNSGWQPYCDRGRWLYTDAGWYWSSDYSWGWAAFHYGRWLNDPRWGWCWTPGYVWGPSWVSWRYSNDYCGWAPLPPAAYYRPGFGFYYQNRSVGFGFGFGLGASAYTFVSWGNFCDSRPWHHRVSGAHRTQIYNNTTIANNFGTGAHNRIINHGVPIDQVRRHAGREIHQVAIREAPSAAGFGSRGERLVRDGRTLLVHRPNVAQSAATTATSARVTRESRPGPAPTSGAGAAVQIAPSREQGHARIAAEARERSARPPSGTLPTVTSQRASENRPAVQSPPASGGTIRATPTTPRPATSGSGSTPRSRDERPTVPNRARTKDGNRSSTTPSLIVRGEERGNATSPAPAPQRSATVNTPSTQKSSPNVIVIGRRDSNPIQPGNSSPERSWTPTRTETPSRSTHNWIADRTTTTPTAAARQVQTPQVSSTPAPSFSYSHSATPTPRYEQRAVTRQFAPPARTYAAPSPAPRSSPSPSYSAPRRDPAPSSSPSRSYSPSRAQSSPSPAQGRSDSGRQGPSRRN